MLNYWTINWINHEKITWFPTALKTVDPGAVTSASRQENIFPREVAECADCTGVVFGYHIQPRLKEVEILI